MLRKKFLAEFGSTRLSLSTTEMNIARGKIVSAVQKVLPFVSEYAARYGEFKEVGKRMLDAWGQGMEDITPDAKPSKSVPALLREKAGLSDPHTGSKRKAANPYIDPDGAFGHKAR